MFKLINGGDKLPLRATRYSSGFDVFANEDKVIAAGQTELIGLGIAIDLAQESAYEMMGLTVYGSDRAIVEKITKFKSTYYLELHIRSSLRAKGLTSLGTGVIDMDFDQEIKMVIHNPIKMVFIEPIEIGDEYVDISVTGSAYGAENQNIKSQGKIKINKGDKIGQLILKRHEGYLLPQEYTLDNERVSGFGSSGTK